MVTRCHREPFGHAQDGLREGTGVGLLKRPQSIAPTPDSSPPARNDIFALCRAANSSALFSGKCLVITP